MTGEWAVRSWVTNMQQAKHRRSEKQAVFKTKIMTGKEPWKLEHALLLDNKRASDATVITKTYSLYVQAIQLLIRKLLSCRSRVFQLVLISFDASKSRPRRVQIRKCRDVLEVRLLNRKYWFHYSRFQTLSWHVAPSNTTRRKEIVGSKISGTMNWRNGRWQISTIEELRNIWDITFSSKTCKIKRNGCRCFGWINNGIRRMLATVAGMDCVLFISKMVLKLFK